MQTENSSIPYGYIYKITNKISGKCYIGQTVHIKNRLYMYKKLLCKRQPKILSALKKYGIENFSFDVFDTAADKETLDFLETSYILCFDSINSGYNCMEGGANGKHSSETKQKCRISSTGRTQSIETCLKKSAALSGRVFTDEHRKNISKTRSGIRTGIKQGMFGRHHSEETKRKISEQKKLASSLRKRKLLLELT